MRRGGLAGRLAVAALALAPALAGAQGTGGRVLSQILYLPVYSNVWHGELDRQGKPQKTLVSTLVSIRNTDPSRPIRVSSAVYHDTGGKRLREYVPTPQTVAPLSTLELFVERADDSGGSGASFVIAWTADRPANPPLVEALHVNAPAGRPIVFGTRAVPILPE